MPVLQAHKQRQDNEKSQAGSVWNERNLVFCSNVGTILEPRRVCTTMDKIAESAGLEKFTFHAMRHSFATRMLEANVPAKVVQDILGHADVTPTLNTYSHVVGTTAHEQIAKINDLFIEKDETPQFSTAPKGISIQKRLAEDREAKKEKTEEKPPPEKSKNRNDLDL